MRSFDYLELHHLVVNLFTQQQLAQTFPPARQSRHYGAQRHVENARRFGIAELLQANLS